MLEGLVNLNYAIASLRVNVGCWALEWMLYPEIDMDLLLQHLLILRWQEVREPLV